MQYIARGFTAGPRLSRACPPRRLTHSLAGIKQSGTLRVRGGHVTLAITTAWQDFVSVSSSLADVEVRASEADNTLHLAPRESHLPIALALVVPEYFNLDVRATHLDLSIANKLMGSVVAESETGSVRLDKAKGDALHFHIEHGDVTVRKALEGSIRIRCKSFAAKMINCSQIHASCRESIRIDALYCNSFAELESGGDIDVSNLKGTFSARSARGPISVRNIEGAFRVCADAGDVHLQINKLSAHPGTGEGHRRCAAEASAGSLTALVDAQVASDVDLEVAAAASSEGAAPLTLLLSGFTGAQSSSRALGALTSQPAQLRREKHSSGKVSVAAAAVQSLAASEAADPPVLFLRAAKAMRVETMSWKDAIRRRYGL